MASDLELRLYEKMVLIRSFEERIGELFKSGELFGTTHPCIGQEATAAGVIEALQPGDVVTSTHRGHGHFLAFTDNPNGLMAEIMGKETGVCAGRGGSQHVYSKDFYTNGITGGMAVVGTGMALAEKREGSGHIVVSFLGDGALGQGVLSEAMNMASLWDAPVLYALENNLYGMSTHVDDAVAGSVQQRVRAMDVECARVDVVDVLEVVEILEAGVAVEPPERVPTEPDEVDGRCCGEQDDGPAYPSSAPGRDPRRWPTARLQPHAWSPSPDPLPLPAPADRISSRTMAMGLAFTSS